MSDQHSVPEMLRAEVASILRLKVEQVEDDVDIFEIGMDSLDFIELAVYIENKYSIDILEMLSDTESKQSYTIENLAAAIERYRKDVTKQ